MGGCPLVVLYVTKFEPNPFSGLRDIPRQSYEIDHFLNVSPMTYNCFGNRAKCGLGICSIHTYVLLVTFSSQLFIVGRYSVRLVCINNLLVH